MYLKNIYLFEEISTNIWRFIVLHCIVRHPVHSLYLKLCIYLILDIEPTVNIVQNISQKRHLTHSVYLEQYIHLNLDIKHTVYNLYFVCILF